MTSDTQRDHTGRTFKVQAYGNTAEEVELDALDKARAFFGGDLRLTVVRDYTVVPAYSSRSEDRRHTAHVTIRVEESAADG